jgi:hypothetical protein
MPYITHDKQRPYAPQSETSQEGARKAHHSAMSQCGIMARIYRAFPLSGLSDYEMHCQTGYAINVICARRNDLECVKVGTRRGPHGVTVAAWALPGAKR